jgi:hypothetical protein
VNRFHAARLMCRVRSTGVPVREHADHGEWLVVVLDQADRGDTVGQTSLSPSL